MTTTRALLATVLAVAAVLAGALALDRWSGDPGESAVGASTALPAAPEGMRWVGMDDVVVAVPDWWSTGETQCGAPVEDTVYFDAAAVYDCEDPADPATVREVSALAVFDGTCCYGEWKLRTMEPVDGSPAVDQAQCDDWFEGVCRRLFALPGTDVMFAVTIAEEGDGSYETIRDSVRRLPDGMTTVPLKVSGGWTPTWGAEPEAAQELGQVLERAGLRVDVERVRPDEGRDAGLRADLPRGSLLEVSPSLGSVVEDGATVTVTLAG